MRRWCKKQGEEIEHIREKDVYKKITRKEAQERGIKVVGVRWIDVNKGDEKSPKYRSRLVAKEFRTKEQEGENLFAGTPPLEALKALVSDAATVTAEKPRGGSLMIADVSRAFFEAKAKRLVCVELAEEDRTEEDKKMDRVGLLAKSMYGTQDAAANWQEEVAKEMRGWGFRRGRYNPCVYTHIERKIKSLVHGDDFAASGGSEDLKWMRGKLEERFQIKTSTVGPEKEQEKEVRILNRIVRRTERGWEYEADQRHAEIIIEATRMGSANGVKTPGEDPKEGEGEENEELGQEESTKFRALAARANYLAADRQDIQYAVKELCRGMSRPRRVHQAKLKRLARYLVDRPRMVNRYAWQKEECAIEVYGDSNWAGCKETGRSTSGGVAMRGSHVLRSWSHTQKTVALSSGEAELTALVKASCEGLGLKALMADWGEDFDVIVYADASAALGVVGRKGAGKLRHVNIGMLWVQDKAAEEEVKYRKILGEKNPGDLMTKNNAFVVMQTHLETLKIEFPAGRAALSSELSRGINSFKLVKRFIISTN